jgi:hypothetical protein
MFEHVDWTHADHMRDKHNVTEDQADEALRDPDRVVIEPDYKSRSGKSARILGYSQSFDDLLTLIVVTEDGKTYGVNGWRANAKDRRIYNGEEQ